MSIIRSIKNVFGNYFLRMEMKTLRRNKTFMNMEQAKTVGIVFDATYSENFDLVKKYISYLRDMKKKVKAIGFFNQKGTPPMAYSKLEYDFFSIKDLNWYSFPDNLYVRNFIDDEYDILLDLNIHDSFPLKYVSALSKARFKVGKRSEKNSSIFDLMIDADASQGMKYFLRNMDSYLSIINKKYDTTVTANEQV